MAEDSELYARSSARLGSTIKGKYRLDRVIGIGGMAVVFAATHRNLKRFAVKMLHAELSIREDIRTRFLREGYAANSLEHPGAVAVLDDDVAEDGSAFLVMELLEGDGLDGLWEKSGRRMSPQVVLAVGFQLLDVLAAAHAKGIVHRDIKPPNIFLTRDGTLKVLDFGIARVRDAVASGQQHTGTGMLLGTPAFMAPEQALAKSSEINGQTDVWAAGATLFTLLSGELVHEGENAPQLMIKAATTQARSLAAVAPNAPTSVVQLIDQALAFDKAVRWDSAEAMRDALGNTYQALYGEPVARAPLAGLFREPGHPLVPTLHGGRLASPSTAGRGGPEASAPRTAYAASPSAHSIGAPQGAPVPPSRTSAPTTRSVPGGTLPAGATPAGSYPGPSIGMTTSKPVSSDGPETPYGVPSRKRKSPALIGALAVGVLGIAFTTFELGTRSRAATAAAPPANPSTTTTASAEVAFPVATPQPHASAVASTGEPASSASAAESPQPSKSPAPKAAVAPSHPRVTTPASEPTTAAPSPAASAASAGPARKVNCTPPYVIDSSGKHVYKPECL